MLVIRILTQPVIFLKGNPLVATCFVINGKAIDWSPEKQVSVSFLSCEAEYIALPEADNEVIFIHHFFDDINVLNGFPIVNCDNNSAVNLA